MTKPLYLAALCLTTSTILAQAPTPQARPFPNETKFTGPDGYAWSAQSASRPYNITLQDATFRFEIHPEDHWPHDGVGSKKNRAEISGLTVPDQGESTISYEVKLVQGDFSIPGVEHIIGQRHGHRDPNDALNEHPDIAFRIRPGGRPSLTVAGSSEDPLVTIPRSIDAWTGTAAQFERNVWHQLRIVAMAGNSGWVDLWLDGKLMKSDPQAAHTYTGPFGYVNREDDYWKFGDYCPAGLTAPVIVEIRNIHRSLP